jgi:hypothetical protein
MNKTIILSVEQARNMYPTAQPDFKALLEANFTKEELQGSIIYRISCFADILSFATERQRTNYQAGYAYLLPNERYRRQAILITEVLNEGWVADWDDTTQEKRLPYFKGSGLSFGGVGYWNASTFVGSRPFAFRSRELAEFAVNTFPEIFKGF